MVIRQVIRATSDNEEERMTVLTAINIFVRCKITVFCNTKK